MGIACVDRSARDPQQVRGDAVSNTGGESGAQPLGAPTSSGRRISDGSDLRGDDASRTEEMPAERHCLPDLGGRHRVVFERQRERDSYVFRPPGGVGAGLEQAGDLFEQQLVVDDPAFDVRAPRSFRSLATIRLEQQRVLAGRDLEPGDDRRRVTPKLRSQLDDQGVCEPEDRVTIAMPLDELGVRDARRAQRMPSTRRPGSGVQVLPSLPSLPASIAWTVRRATRGLRAVMRACAARSV